ncbi:hypothetical protein Nepgr_014968 [Nepenthes gracilis]|uniref:TRF2/HOY1 PH-like domain-containing protein n=1 Tax=Nepenthes gracilis TaxID=150966 RepID=A0AAD3SMA0_NEPGR|nr:hypothetical protein Nepgr_014968 [Nepenthes gracilis]
MQEINQRLGQKPPSLSLSSSSHAVNQKEGELKPAANFPALSLRIGSWKMQSQNEGQLVVKFYFKKRRRLAWEILDKNVMRKMEIMWSDISTIRATPIIKPRFLHIKLERPPQFFREKDPQPRKPARWVADSDFTTDIQASLVRCHRLEFDSRVLSKLLRSDSSLFHFSKERFFSDGANPYFQEFEFKNLSHQCVDDSGTRPHADNSRLQQRAFSSNDAIHRSHNFAPPMAISDSTAPLFDEPPPAGAGDNHRALYSGSSCAANNNTMMAFSDELYAYTDFPERKNQTIPGVLPKLFHDDLFDSDVAQRNQECGVFAGEVNPSKLGCLGPDSLAALPCNPSMNLGARNLHAAEMPMETSVNPYTVMIPGNCVEHPMANGGMPYALPLIDPYLIELGCGNLMDGRIPMEIPTNPCALMVSGDRVEHPMATGGILNARPLIEPSLMELCHGKQAAGGTPTEISSNPSTMTIPRFCVEHPTSNGGMLYVLPFIGPSSMESGSRSQGASAIPTEISTIALPVKPELLNGRAINCLLPSAYSENLGIVLQQTGNYESWYEPFAVASNPSSDDYKVS